MAFDLLNYNMDKLMKPDKFVFALIVCRVFNICDIINRTFGSISISDSFKIDATCDNRSNN